MKPGIEIIADERKRQIGVKGYSSASDLRYSKNELVNAATCYLLSEIDRRRIFWPWPWTRSFWKPTPDDRVRELAKAGALIAAEIDRINNSK